MERSQKPKKPRENIHAGHRERMRKKIHDGGYRYLEPHEKLELLLYYACPRADTNPIAHRLLYRFGSVTAVFDAPYEELLQVDGIGEVAATLLKLVPLLLKDYEEQKLGEVRLYDADSLGNFLIKQFIGYEDREALMVVAMNAKGHVISCAPLMEGNVDTLPIRIKRVVEFAIRSHATSIIISHNHPSGNLFPSFEDIQITRRIHEALLLVEIRLQDHIIVAGQDYLSFSKLGMLRDIIPTDRDPDELEAALD